MIILIQVLNEKFTILDCYSRHPEVIISTSRVKQKVSASITLLLALERKHYSAVLGCSMGSELVFEFFVCMPFAFSIIGRIFQYNLTPKN